MTSVFMEGETNGYTPGQSTPGDVLQDLVSDETRLVFQWLCYTVLGQLVSLFGIVTNVINIICFVKQGFSETVNISLLGLAISDLCSLVFITWTDICYNPVLNELDLSFDPLAILYLTGAWPHVVFTRVTSLITAFVALERCLCLTMPLKVKTLVTPKRVTIIILSIFVILITSAVPFYYINTFGQQFSPTRNRTLLTLVHISGLEQMETVLYALNNVFIPFGAFVTVSVCTLILIINMKMKRKWREKSITSRQFENLSNRDQKVAAMMIMISALFIVCFFPVVVFFIAMIVVPELSVGGRYTNTLIVLGSLGFVLESINAATNVFIYYHMSSRYRTVFQQIICRC